MIRVMLVLQDMQFCLPLFSSSNKDRLDCAPLVLVIAGKTLDGCCGYPPLFPKLSNNTTIFTPRNLMESTKMLFVSMLILQTKLANPHY